MSDSDRNATLESLAYQSWLARGQPLGSPDVDWQRAIELLDNQAKDNVEQQRDWELTTVAPVLSEAVAIKRSAAKHAATGRSATQVRATQSTTLKNKQLTKRMTCGETPLEVPPTSPAPPPPTPTEAAAAVV